MAFSFSSAPLLTVAARLAGLLVEVDLGYIFFSNLPVWRSGTSAMTYRYPVSPTSSGVLLLASTEDATSTRDSQQHVPSGLLEYVFDEIRAVVNLLVSGTVTRCPEIKFVMSHAGCVLPPVPEFVAVALQSFFGGTMNSTEMRRLLTESFHFDLAGLPWPDMIHGLLGTVGPDRLVYGSDYCWTPVPMVKRLFEMMDQGANEIWTVDTIKEVYSGNAKRLFDL